jgi:murein DD-endopeptidase MepM/ murein hydrolase activator NlpD
MVTKLGFGVLGLTAITASVVSYAQSGSLWTVPVKFERVNYGYFDPNYWKGDSVRDRRQHLGVDLRIGAGQPVYSPVKGTVVTNNTASNVPVGESYLVIRAANGEEHVLGHISSSRRPGSAVYAGLVVGTIRAWPNNTHLHWGVNRGRIPSGVIGGWGWGKAPYEATQPDAARRGWVNINSYVGLAENIKLR